ncbi:MAG: DUF3365 domain-containing protein [bacterium]
MSALKPTITLLLVGGLVALCTPTPKPKPTTRPTAAPQQRAVKLGQQAASKLRAALGRRVRAAMQQGGPAQAIAVCAGDALNITADVNRQLSKGVTIRRTSLRYRNPKNAPDAAEKRALSRLAVAGSSDHILEQEHHPGGTVYRYYQPIRTVGMCLRCHGPANKLAPPVQAILKQRYPDDRATGYKPGDLRGIFSVTIPTSALE